MNKRIALLLLAAALSAPFAEAQKTKKKSKLKTKTVQVQSENPETAVAVAPALSAETYAAPITAADLSTHLHILASDEFEGRETGRRGQKMAAEYISNFFRENDIPGPVNNDANPHYQVFDLEQSIWNKPVLKVGKNSYTFLKDFYLYGDAPAEKRQKLDLVFAGYGIEAPTYSDYQNLNVKGKTVVVLTGEPTDEQGNFLVSRSKTASPWADSRTKARTALQKGAKNVIFIASGTEEQFLQQLEKMKHRLESPDLSLPERQRRTPSVFVSPGLGAALLGSNAKNLQNFQNQVRKAGKPVAAKFKPAREVELSAEKTLTAVTTENVLGYIEGSDKKEEVIVITAHYDHVGMDPEKEGDQIYNGADDDGSGTVAIMELAQAFAEAKKAGAGPRRSILFMAVTGEEKGLLGSEYYTNHPVFPLANTVANLNIDMIGRLDNDHEGNPNYVYLIGSDKLSSELHKISEETNQRYNQLELDYTYNDEKDPNRFYYRSDHYNFAKNNIPVIFYFNGVHDDYHQPGDEVEKILFDKVENITRLVFYTAWELANREERIKVDSNKK